MLSLPHVKPSIFSAAATKGVRCTLCHRGCILEEGRVGVCGMRFALGGRLYTAAYGLLTAAESRPMEIKPLFHFYPGTSAVTISTWGCNFPCAWCQNWHLSKTAALDGVYVPPGEVVKWALDGGDAGVNISFNEPALLAEYAVDLFREAKKAGLHCSINTNGYVTPEALKLLADAGMEGLNIDIKGGRKTYEKWLAADFEKWLETARAAVNLGLHVELTYLVIPGVNDHEADEVVNTAASLGVPLHITAYAPAHRLNNPPTPPELLHQLWRKARRELEYVYVGNIPGHPGQHTYCPKCGHLVVKRGGDRVVSFRLDGKKCLNCGHEIAMRGVPGRYGRLYKSFI